MERGVAWVLLRRSSALRASLEREISHNPAAALSRGLGSRRGISWEFAKSLRGGERRNRVPAINRRAEARKKERESASHSQAGSKHDATINLNHVRISASKRVNPSNLAALSKSEMYARDEARAPWICTARYANKITVDRASRGAK